MSTSVQVLADSLAPCGKRLTTVLCRYPRIIHAQLLTHRMLSRNSASSRAVPTAKAIAAVEADPFVPSVFGENRPGMSAGQAVGDQEVARTLWLSACRNACRNARALATLGVAKQWANRILEPFSHIETLISATDWENFFRLRCADDAQPEFQELACRVRDSIVESVPARKESGGVHAPFSRTEDFDLSPEDRLDVWVSRCARLSYLSHDGGHSAEANVRLARRLRLAGHWSPFEHVAFAMSTAHPAANYVGWSSMRNRLEILRSVVVADSEGGEE